MISQIGELAKEYWYIFIALIGVLLILGAIFKWRWVLQSDGEPALGFLSFVRDVFGITAYRIAIILIGMLLIAFSIAYPMLLGMM